MTHLYFLADLLGVLAQEQKAEMDMWLEEEVQTEIDLAKLESQFQNH